MEEARELHERKPEDPNHIIIWLDASIGEPGKYIHLKKAFGSNTDPTTEFPTMLGDRDYENLLREEHATPVTFEGVTFLLHCVDTIEKCTNSFKQHLSKRIFFITSGNLGKTAVPLLIEKFPQKFCDPCTNQALSNVFVFCHDIQRQLDWAIPFLNHILTFNFDKDLLTRLLREISNYFYEISIRFRDNRELKKARRNIKWSKKLWDQYQKNLSNSTTDNPVPATVDNHTLEIETVITDIKNRKLESQTRFANDGASSGADTSDSDDDSEKGAQPS